MNKIIVDGYNVIHRIPELRHFLDVSLERAREELLRLLKSYLLNKKLKITVVFDGQHPMGREQELSTPKLRVVFSNHPFKADPYIKRLVAKEKNKKALAMVSDDSDLVQFAGAFQVKVMSTSAFYELLSKRAKTNDIHNKFDHELSEEELSEWLEIFGEKNS